MKYKLIRCGIILSLGCISACAPLQGNQKLQADLTRVQSRVASLEQQVAQQEKNGANREVLRRQAEQSAELDGMRIDIQSINGRIDDQDKALEQLREQISLRQTDLELRVAELEDQLQGTGKSKTSVLATQNEMSPSLPAADALETASSSDTPSAATPSEAPGQNPPADSAEELYREALRLVQQDMRFAESREKFSEFVEQYPQHELAVNAMYWIGETMYGDKKYENAILQFQDVIQMYPQHSKVPAALLKQGLSFYGLGDERNARIILQKVTEKYPDSPEAKKAQERLGKW